MSKNNRHNLEVIHLAKNATVESYFKIGELLVPVNTHVTTLDDLRYDFKSSDKLEAMYHTVVFRLQHGTPFSNYSKSKYRDYYYEKLFKEYPELLI